MARLGEQKPSHKPSSQPVGCGVLRRRPLKGGAETASVKSEFLADEEVRAGAQRDGGIANARSGFGAIRLCCVLMYATLAARRWTAPEHAESSVASHDRGYSEREDPYAFDRRRRVVTIRRAQI